MITSSMTASRCDVSWSPMGLMTTQYDSSMVLHTLCDAMQYKDLQDYMDSAMRYKIVSISRECMH